IILTKLFNPILHLMRNRVKIVNKVFGNLTYESKMSTYRKDYQVKDLRDSILETEVESNHYENLDILLMGDNSIESVGGEQESTKIIINGIKNSYSLGVIQPGNIKNPLNGVHYFSLTSETRIKHLIKRPVSFIEY